MVANVTCPWPEHRVNLGPVSIGLATRLIKNSSRLLYNYLLFTKRLHPNNNRVINKHLSSYV